jgi:hypothetical protein
MSPYSATARTNYFKVKDVDALKAELIKYGITPASFAEASSGETFVVDDGINAPDGSIALFSFAAWPSFQEDAIAERLEVEDVRTVPAKHNSLHSLVSAHLVEREVAIFIEVGSEKLNYLRGVTIAVNAAGETRRLDLDDIFELAMELTDEDTVITRPYA